MSQAVEISNGNASLIDGTLRASGSVDGHFTTESGSKRSYHLSGVLFVLTPSHMRFDLKKLGSTQILFGSNDEAYWVYGKQDDAFHCGWQGEFDERVAALPARPDQLIDALGLTPIPRCTPGGAYRIVQRIVAEFQQILFLTDGPNEGVLIEKEYWLDRFAPQLVRRVVFRNSDGMVEMESHLDDYRRRDAKSPWLPHSVLARWPLNGAEMHFSVAKWSSVPQVQPGSIQFTTPEACVKDQPND